MAVTRALFFDSDFFYENTEVDENVDLKLIRPTIWDVQEIYIMPLIGQPLYEVIEAEIIANGGALTTQRLIDLVDGYVAPAHLKYVMMQLQVPLLYKFRNKSTLTDRTDSSTPIDFAEMRHLKDFYKAMAETYSERTERFLIANGSIYPEYRNFATSDQVRSKSQGASVSVYLPAMSDRRDGDCHDCIEKG